MSVEEEFEGVPDGALADLVDQLWAACQATEGQLKASGIVGDVALKAHQRLNFVIDHVVGPPKSRERSLFEIEWCRYVANDQAQAMARVNRARLLAPGQVPKLS